MRNLREGFDEDQREIDEIALNNGFLDDMVDSLQYSNKLEKTDDGWVYLRSDYGGRDFFDEIPIQYIDEDELRDIEEYCILDSGIEDYDWGGYSGDIGYVQELLFDHFADLLIDHLDDLDALDENLKESNKRLYSQYINKIKKATTKDELITLERRAYNEKEFSKYDLEEISRAVDERAVKILNQIKFTESKKRRKIKESKEESLDKTDLETLLTAVKETLDYFDYHNKNLTKKQDYVLDDLKDIYQEIKRGR